MSSGSKKRLKRTIRKAEDQIKIIGLTEFFAYSETLKLKKRIALACRIIFRMGL